MSRNLSFDNVSPWRRLLLLALALVALVGASACGGDNRRCARPPNSWQDETVKPFERDDDDDGDDDDDDDDNDDDETSDDTSGDTGDESGAVGEQPATAFFYLSDDVACDE